MSSNFSVYADTIDDPIIYEYDELPEALERFFNAVAEGEFAQLSYSS